MRNDEDPYMVDPEDHRGDDRGILAREFELPRERPDNDYRGPRPLSRYR